MKICPDCGQELSIFHAVTHDYYRCLDCDILFVERGKGAFFKCRELTSFNFLLDNKRKPDICDDCEKRNICQHVGFGFYGCRSIEGAELKAMIKENDYWHFVEPISDEINKAHKLFRTKED